MSVVHCSKSREIRWERRWQRKQLTRFCQSRQRKRIVENLTNLLKDNGKALNTIRIEGNLV